jgi:hypothetical protein
MPMKTFIKHKITDIKIHKIQVLIREYENRKLCISISKNYKLIKSKRNDGTDNRHPRRGFFFLSFCFCAGLITTFIAASKTALTFCNNMKNVIYNMIIK